MKETYDISKCEVLTRNSYIKHKVDDLIEALNCCGLLDKWNKQKEQEAIERYGKQYDDLLENDYDIGGLITAYIKVKQVVIYNNSYCLIDTKNKLYYIYD